MGIRERRYGGKDDEGRKVLMMLVGGVKYSVGEDYFFVQAEDGMRDSP